MNLPDLAVIAGAYLRPPFPLRYEVPREHVIDVYFYTGHEVVPGDWPKTTMHGDPWRELVRMAVATREELIAALTRDRIKGTLMQVSLAYTMFKAREAAKRRSPNEC